MRIRDAFGIYHVLENRLKASATPLTCVDLFDDGEIKQFADSVSRVSDYLGHMYRRGLLSREPAPKSINSQARWAYFWKNRSEVTPARPVGLKVVPPQPSPPQPSGAVRIFSKPNIEITENGGTVVIDLPELSITIRTKH